LSISTSGPELWRFEISLWSVLWPRLSRELDVRFPRNFCRWYYVGGTRTYGKKSKIGILRFEKNDFKLSKNRVTSAVTKSHKVATLAPSICKIGHPSVPVVANCDSTVGVLCSVSKKPGTALTVFRRFDLENRCRRVSAPSIPVARRRSLAPRISP